MQNEAELLLEEIVKAQKVLEKNNVPTREMCAVLPIEQFDLINNNGTIFAGTKMCFIDKNLKVIKEGKINNKGEWKDEG